MNERVHKKQFVNHVAYVAPSRLCISTKMMLVLSDTAGSCSMLPREKEGVVDPKLKVRNLPLM